MVWNLLNDTEAHANGVKLPEMHTKPYIEYGLGLQRHWGERFTAFGQAMVRNGGRNGISFTAGFRWSLGDNNKKTKNEKSVNKDTAKKELTMDQLKHKTVIKSLKPNMNLHHVSNSI